MPDRISPAATSASEKAVGPVTFFDREQPRLGGLFELVGVSAESADSLETAVQVTQPWVKGDHSRPENRFRFDDERSRKLHGLYARLGLKDQHPLPAGRYDHLLVFGAIHRGNNHRLGFLRRTLDMTAIEVPHITLLGGERPVYPEVELDDIDRNLTELADAGVHDGWLDRIRDGQAGLHWETDLLRLAALVHLGPIALRRSVGGEEKGTARPRQYDFMWHGRALTLMHTKAVERRGEPRHTTEACVLDWLQRTDPPEDAHVAFVAANPHIERMGKTVRAMLRREGRPDIRITAAGPSAPKDISHNHCLGEIARNLYEDMRLLEVGGSLPDRPRMERQPGVVRQ